MNHPYSLKVILTMALTAVAIMALAGLAIARDRHHHRHSGAPAGGISKIESFDAGTGRLVIDLENDETVSGLVTNRTKIKCEDEHSSPSVAMRARRGEVEPGDDHGGQGEEPGDVHGGGDSSGPGSSNSGPGGHDNGVGPNCATSALVPGAIVRGAELEIEHGQAAFDEVELAG